MAKKVILVVDDDPRIVKLLKLNLERAGYLVATAADGREALKKLAGGLPHLLILDIGLPHLTGLDLLKTIRADERMHDLPVIMLTAYKTDQDVFRGYNYGANVYLTKPVNPVVLLEYIRDLFADIEHAAHPDDVYTV